VTVWRLWKGHGTENDFLVLPDLDGQLDLSADLVRRLCDRRAGLGAAGVLRVVRAGGVADIPAGGASFAMDYRNADGSLAEMCGNGLRVFARYLQHAGLIEDEVLVATRGGVHRVWGSADDELTSVMGRPHLLPQRPTVTTAGVTATGTALEIPNPHVVVTLDSAAAVDALDLTAAPHVDPALPAGQNVEFVASIGPQHLHMRVHERGVGETRSCGTGICAAVVACAKTPGGPPWRVDVPGGRCIVTWRADGEVELAGPAVLVGSIELAPEWLG
jgi:diaminopimelate epimerase